MGYEETRQDFLNEIFDETDLKTEDVRLALGAAIVEEMRAEVFKQTQFRLVYDRGLIKKSKWLIMNFCQC